MPRRRGWRSIYRKAKGMRVQTPEINLGEVLRQVAHEKDIDMARWVAALEDAMASAAKKQHRIKEPVRSNLDLETGSFEAFIVKQVVEEVEALGEGEGPRHRDGTDEGGGRVALLVQQPLDGAYHLDVFLSVEALLGSRLRRRHPAEFRLPVTQHMRLHSTEVANFTNSKVTFPRYRR